MSRLIPAVQFFGIPDQEMAEFAEPASALPQGAVLIGKILEVMVEKLLEVRGVVVRPEDKYKTVSLFHPSYRPLTALDPKCERPIRAMNGIMELYDELFNSMMQVPRGPVEE
ncbi:MAG: hypothetical protein G01um101438_129 [Parcubacteria group bacterium Gr01-1014_38]|nr:MAG: hypothetical protein G01um101438_129 [Parcubacteria group bacterium Gr01-1014_38]